MIKYKTSFCFAFWRQLGNLNFSFLIFSMQIATPLLTRKFSILNFHRLKLKFKIKTESNYFLDLFFFYRRQESYMMININRGSFITGFSFYFET
jgi:hypothetical protein